MRVAELLVLWSHMYFCMVLCLFLSKYSIEGTLNSSIGIGRQCKTWMMADLLLSCCTTLKPTVEYSKEWVFVMSEN